MPICFPTFCTVGAKCPIHSFCCPRLHLQTTLTSGSRSIRGGARRYVGESLDLKGALNDYFLSRLPGRSLDIIKVQSLINFLEDYCRHVEAGLEIAVQPQGKSRLKKVATPKRECWIDIGYAIRIYIYIKSLTLDSFHGNERRKREKRERERVREREREREWETDRQTDKQTNRQTNRQTDKQTVEKEREREMDCHCPCCRWGETGFPVVLWGSAGHMRLFKIFR